MRDDDAVTKFVAELRRNIGTDHSIEKIRKGFSGSKSQSLRLAVLVPLEVVRRRSQYAKPPVTVAERQRYNPRHVRLRSKVPEARPGDVVGGVANPKNRVKQ